MKKLLLIALMLGLNYSIAFAANTTIGTYTLAPAEKKEISIPATKPETIGFNNDAEIDELMRRSKEHEKINLQEKGSGMVFGSPDGGSMEYKPINGKIDLILENATSKTLKIELYKK